MQRIIVIALLTFCNVSAQQKNLNKEFLIGCWSLLIESDPSTSFLTFKACESLDEQESTLKPLTFYLFSDQTSKFYIPTTSQFICFHNIYKSTEGTWNYDSESKILTLLYSEEKLITNTNEDTIKDDVSKIAYQFTINTLLPEIFTTPLESVVINTVN